MVQVKNLLQFESVSHGLTFHTCCNKLQLRIIHDIDLIPIHLILSKQSIVKPQETAVSVTELRQEHAPEKA